MLIQLWKEIPWEEDTVFIHPQRRKYLFIHSVYYTCMSVRGVEDSNLHWTGTLSTLLEGTSAVLQTGLLPAAHFPYLGLQLGLKPETLWLADQPAAALATA